MLGYLSADIICSERRTVFQGRSSRKTASFEEQIKSKRVSDGNRIDWSPIRSVIIRVITKSDDRAFVYHEYDYRLNWTTRSPIIMQ